MNTISSRLGDLNESLIYDATPNKIQSLKVPVKVLWMRTAGVHVVTVDASSSSMTFIGHWGLTPPPPPGCLSMQQGRRRQLVVNGLTKLPGSPPAARK